MEQAKALSSNPVDCPAGASAMGVARDGSIEGCIMIPSGARVEPIDPRQLRPSAEDALVIALVMVFFLANIVALFLLRRKV